MSDSRIGITIGFIGVFLFFACFIMFLWFVGYFDFTGSEAYAKIVASTIALVGGFISSLVTSIGVFLKNSLDQRNADLKENAERRLKLEAATQAMKLLSTERGEDVPMTQRSGVLFTLLQLGYLDLVVAMLDQMLSRDRIDASTAVWLINHVLESNFGDLSVEAAGLLEEYHDKLLVDNGQYEFPRCLNLKCNTKLPKLARRAAILALLRLVCKRRYADWENDSLNAILATLISIWRDETDGEIRDGAGICLKAMKGVRAGKVLFLPSHDIVVDEVQSELKTKHFNTTSEFERISKNVKDWSEGANVTPDSVDR